MSEKKSNKLPIILLATGCVAGGILGYSYNKVSSSTEYVFAKTGKNLYSETKKAKEDNVIFTDLLTILDDEYTIGFDSNTEKIGISANYNTALDTYNFNISFLGAETNFSLDNFPFSFGINDAEITDEQEDLIEELKTNYNLQLATLFLNSETSNMKYSGEEDFDREIIFTVDADALNAIYTEYTSTLKEIITEDTLNEIQVTTSNGFSFDLKEGIVGSLIKSQIENYADKFVKSKFFSSDVVVTLNSKNGIIKKATIDSDNRNLTAYFDPKNLYNSESTINLSNDIFDITIKITPEFTENLWTLDLNIYNTSTPNDNYTVSYKWDLVSTTDNFAVTKNDDGVVEEKLYTISGDIASGITLEGEKLNFFLEKVMTQE